MRNVYPIEEHIMKKAKSSSGKARKSTSSSTTHRFYDDGWAIAETLFRSRRDLGAEKLQAIAEATREYTDSLTSIPALSEQIAFASDAIDELSKYLGKTDLEHIGSDAVTYARRNPLATMGVALVLGVAATRILMPTQEPKKPNKKTKRPKAIRSKSMAGHRSANGSDPAHA
jgi:hypothetical protein